MGKPLALFSYGLTHGGVERVLCSLAHAFKDDCCVIVYNTERIDYECKAEIIVTVHSNIQS